MKSPLECVIYLNNYLIDQLNKLSLSITIDADKIKRDKISTPRNASAIFDYCYEQSNAFALYNATYMLIAHINKSYLECSMLYQTSRDFTLDIFIDNLNSVITNACKAVQFKKDNSRFYIRKVKICQTELLLYTKIINEVLKEKEAS